MQKRKGGRGVKNLHKQISLEKFLEKKLLNHVALLNKKFMKDTGKALYTTGTLETGLGFYPFTVMCKKEPERKI